MTYQTFEERLESNMAEIRRLNEALIAAVNRALPNAEAVTLRLENQALREAGRGLADYLEIYVWGPRDGDKEEYTTEDFVEKIDAWRKVDPK